MYNHQLSRNPKFFTPHTTAPQLETLHMESRNAVKIFTHSSIQLYLPYLSTFLFIVDVIWKTRRNKIVDFVDKGIFFIDGFGLISLTRFFFFI